MDDASELTREGSALLRELVSRLPKVDPTNIQTFPTYTEVHDALQRTLVGKDIGKSLQVPELNDLAA